MKNHSRPPFCSRTIREIDEGGIEGPRARRETPSARILQKLSLAFGFAAGPPVKDSAELMLSERRLWFRFEGNSRPQECIVELEYKFAKELGCQKHPLCNAISRRRAA